MKPPERVEMANAWGEPHGATLGYFGGPLDGRTVRVEVMYDVASFGLAKELAVWAAYSVTRYGVHHEDGSICWVLLTYDPILERGKL